MSCPLSHFDTLFTSHRSFLEAHARRRVGVEDAEDLVCACYQEARSSLPYYQPDRDLRNWLIGILNNLLLLYFRRVRAQHEDSSVDVAAIEVELSNVADMQSAATAHKTAQHRRLYRRIAAVDLTARQYECLQRTLAGDTQQQIAHCLHISQRMVSYHMAAAQERLSSSYDEDNDDDCLDAFDFFHFFCQCAEHAIYRKPHSFDNQSTSEERERHRHEYK